jgi:hypothetical protein
LKKKKSSVEHVSIPKETEVLSVIHPKSGLLTIDIEKKNGEDKYKYITNDSKNYFTYDNSDRPFLVMIFNDHIDVYASTSQFSNDEDKTVYIKSLTIGDFEFVFVGKANKEEVYKKIEPDTDRHVGNSFLVKIKKHTYIFIGETIHIMKTTGEILEYFSPMGNSGVPYPYAISKNKTYLPSSLTVINGTYDENNSPEPNEGEPYPHKMLSNRLI